MRFSRTIFLGFFLFLITGNLHAVTLGELKARLPQYEIELNKIIQTINEQKRPQYDLLFKGASLASALVELSDVKAEKLQFARRGFKIAKLMLKYYPDRAGSYYYAALHLGYVSLFEGPQYTLYYLPKIRQWLMKAISLNPGLHNGSPLILACALYFESPGYPVSIGDIYKAKKFCEESINRFPHTCTAYLYLAAIYNVLGENRKALDLLTTATQKCRVPGEYLENLVYYLKDKKSAEEMIKEIKQGHSVKYFMRNR